MTASNMKAGVLESAEHFGVREWSVPVCLAAIDEAFHEAVRRSEGFIKAVVQPLED